MIWTNQQADGGCWQDYIKVDSCGGANPAEYNTTHPLLSSWFLEAAKAAGRPVLFHPSGIALADSVSREFEDSADPIPSSQGDSAAAPVEVAARNEGVKQYRLFAKIANQWRTYKDMQPIWSEVQDIIDYWAADDPETHPLVFPNEVRKRHSFVVAFPQAVIDNELHVPRPTLTR